MCEENWIMIDPLRKQVKHCLSIYSESLRSLLDDRKLETIGDIEDTIEIISSYRDTVNSLANFLKAKIAMYNARRNAPKRAKALKDCDEILRKLDSIRDIICRSIEGDSDVVCTETGAETIDRWLQPIIDGLPHIAETAYVKPLVATPD